MKFDPDALDHFATLLSERDRVILDEDPAARQVALALLSRFGIGQSWIEIRCAEGQDEAAWRQVDPEEIRSLARDWLAIGAPIARISDCLAVVLLRLAARGIVRRAAAEFRRQRFLRIAVHVSCGSVLLLLVVAAGLLRLTGAATDSTPEVLAAITVVVWMVSSVFASSQRRLLDGQNAALVGFFAKRIEQAAQDLEADGDKRLSVLRRLLPFDDQYRFPAELWPLLGAEPASE